MHQKNYIHYTYEGKILFSLYMASTNDGIILGPKVKNLDLHLTWFIKDGKIRSHIHHGNVNEPNDSPIGRTTSITVASKRFERLFKKRLQIYHGNRKCYVYTKERNQRINDILPKFNNDGDLFFPLELYQTSVDLNFKDKEFWDKVLIRELLKREPFYGFILTKQGIRQVLPISIKHMLVFPLTKGLEFGNLLSELVGINDLLTYIDTIDVIQSDGDKRNIKKVT